jgi:hypothetical protein
VSDAHAEILRNAPRLFPTAAELGVPPVSPRDADLSRIRLLARDSPEGREELRRRTMRRATFTEALPVQDMMQMQEL